MMLGSRQGPARFCPPGPASSSRRPYALAGFKPPLQETGSTATAGQALPVKFQLQDANGNAVTSATATLTVNGQPATSKGGSDATFRVRGNHYQYNLDTTGLSGTVTLTVHLDDATTHSIVVTFTAK